MSKGRATYFILTNILRCTYHMHDNCWFHFYKIRYGGHTKLKGTARQTCSLYDVGQLLYGCTEGSTVSFSGKQVVAFFPAFFYQCQKYIFNCVG